MSTRAITLWFRFLHDGWQFNHIEAGHECEGKPTIKFPTQAGWAGQQWRASRAWLSYDAPPKVVYYDPDLEA
jgi:hypothetical protein